MSFSSLDEKSSNIFLCFGVNQPEKCFFLQLKKVFCFLLYCDSGVAVSASVHCIHTTHNLLHYWAQLSSAPHTLSTDTVRSMPRLFADTTIITLTLCIKTQYFFSSEYNRTLVSALSPNPSFFSFWLRQPTGAEEMLIFVRLFSHPFVWFKPVYSIDLHYSGLDLQIVIKGSLKGLQVVF